MNFCCSAYGCPPCACAFGVGVLYLGGFLILAYALVAPDGVIWLLTVRRTNSHDRYDLFKPPLVTLAFLALLLVFMIIFNIRLTITIPLDSGAYISMVLLSFPTFIMNSVFPFLGVGLSEIIYRVKKKQTV